MEGRANRVKRLALSFWATATIWEVFEGLSGSREGQYGIRINDQWRICFKWIDGDAWDVEVVDCYGRGLNR